MWCPGGRKHPGIGGGSSAAPHAPAERLLLEKLAETRR